ncbi:FAD-dependent oxidoreductase [Deinococcus sp. RL]|uniref:NAD(P)/FAD-dependent oxidoreductase n=1 Tax=Deinococcus sp. RL TaxID=1489678 RepID=UPI0004D8CC4D|nr:FAD-dependent oxidoreductase [Deinococcus sp. RL]KEF33484.1 FAD-dependent oxidoreductase [Deinococcus sp. RL]
MTVLVVGGGLIGSLVGWTLQEAGYPTVVLDAEQPGAAWRAGAGLLTPVGERLRGTPLEEWALTSLQQWPDLARRLEARSGQPVHWRAGVWHGGKLAAREGQVHPPSVVRAARRAVPLWRARVLALHPEHKGVRVLTDRGERRAALVVLAAGVWSAAFGVAVRAQQGQALLLDAPASIPATYGLRRRGAGPAGYALGRPDGLYVGATARPTASPQPDLHAQRWLRGVACRLVPEWAARPAVAQLVGLRPLTPGGLPLVGPHPVLRRVIVATGHGRHGVLLAPWTAARVLALVQGAP